MKKMLLFLVPCSSLLVVLMLRAEDNTDAGNAAPYYRKAFQLMAELTPAEQHLVVDADTAPLDEAARRLVRRAEPAWRELRQGAALARCDWGLDFSEKGFNEQIKLMHPLGQACRLGCLRVRLAFAQKEGTAALDDLAVAIGAARHFGGSGPFISKLGQFAGEGRLIGVAAASLPGLDARMLHALVARLDSLPPSSPMSATMQKEKEFLLQWYRPQVEGKTREEVRTLLRKYTTNEDEFKSILDATEGDAKRLLGLIDDAASSYGELSQILMLAPGEFRNALAAFRKNYAANPLVISEIPSVENMWLAAARIRVSYAMLRAAISVSLDGPQALEKIKDPFGDGPFVCERWAGGFELRSSLKGKDGRSVHLVVGSPKREPERP